LLFVRLYFGVKKMIKVNAIFFSPTGNTRKIINQLVTGHGNVNFTSFDVTRSWDRKKMVSTMNRDKDDPDFWLIGSPVYSGQLPELFVEQIKKLNGKNINTLAIVTYGNKSYGIALKELCKVLVGCNFNVVGLGAFVGEHSYSEKFHVAVNRPDILDLTTASSYGKSFFTSKHSKINENSIDGNIDFIARVMPKGGPKPFLKKELCVGCQTCVINCPVSVIDSESKSFKNNESEKLCLSCMSCVKKCPKKARTYKILWPLELLLNRYYFNSAKIERKDPILIKVNKAV
jgi:ferredoxin